MPSPCFMNWFIQCLCYWWASIVHTSCCCQLQWHSKMLLASLSWYVKAINTVYYWKVFTLYSALLKILNAWIAASSKCFVQLINQKQHIQTCVYSPAEKCSAFCGLCLSFHVFVKGLKTRWSWGGGANTWLWCIVTNLEEGLAAFYKSQRADFNTFWKGKKKQKEGKDRLFSRLETQILLLKKSHWKSKFCLIWDI